MGDLTLMKVDGHVVVTQADDTIVILDDLWAEIMSGRHSDGVEVDGDVVRFGTDGLGRGRVAYRYGTRDVAAGWHVLLRVA